jgi:crotonobetainyl-CoA:carnitine CoA-transferase CaiB-like acyl-CoA transferase
MSGPLSHVRVLDFTALVQGPMATQLLGDLGADVIKFERPGGEWMRSWGILNGRSHGEMDSFLAFNRNKRSVAVDLKDPQVVERILELAADADVVVENFRPGVMARLGLGYEDFRAANPGIIYAASSGYGQTGPYSRRPGQDLLIQALSGLLFLTGRKHEPPTACGVGISDQYTALHIAIGILAALAHRTETGQGQKIEVDLFSCTVAMQQQELTYFLNHKLLPERPEENLGSVWATAPFGIYRTADGYIAIAMTPCPVLAAALDLPWLEQFDTLEKMVASRAEIYAGLSEHFSGGTSERWIALLLEHDVWCAPAQTYEQLVEDPQVAHNELFWDVPVGAGEATFRTPGSPFRFSLTPAEIRYGVPRAGQHTGEFFAEAEVDGAGSGP